MTQTIQKNHTENAQPKRVVLKFHPLVRIAHWTNIIALIGLCASGLSIYWASPVFKIPTADGSKDIFTFIGEIGLKIFPENSESARNWFFDHFALGAGNLAYALNLHWLFAYLYMAVSLCYLAGSIRSGGYRALLPRTSDLGEGIAMIRYYLNIVPALLRKKENPHPKIIYKYNALQRSAYFSVCVCTGISIATGWAIHKPAQLGWLQGLFGGYDFARVIHFLMMVFFALFVIPHVVLVIAEGWDCFRSMVVGWSDNPKEEHVDS